MGWTARNLTQRYGAPAAAGRPTAYLLATDGTRHVVYREAGPGLLPTGHLIELYCGSDDVWHPKDITDEASAAPATSDPSGYAFDAEGSQHVVYLSGDDGSAAEAMLAGASGTISVVANLVPKAFRALCDAARSGDVARTRQASERLAPLIDALNCAPNPIPVKAGLAALGLGSAAPRLPLVELEPGPALTRLHETLAALAPLASAA